jgi:hypothetical protein
MASTDIKALLTAWIAQYIRQDASFRQGTKVPSKYLEELIDLLIKQGDNTTEIVAHVRDYINEYAAEHADTHSALQLLMTQLNSRVTGAVSEVADAINQTAQATDAANKAAADTNTAINIANQAANTAMIATNLANTARDDASIAKINADAAAQTATTAASTANIATDKANNSAIQSDTVRKQLSDAYNSLLNQGVLSTNIAEKLLELEQNYAPTLLEKLIRQQSIIKCPVFELGSYDPANATKIVNAQRIRTQFRLGADETSVILTLLNTEWEYIVITYNADGTYTQSNWYKTQTYTFNRTDTPYYVVFRNTVIGDITAYPTRMSEIVKFEHSVNFDKVLSMYRQDKDDAIFFDVTKLQPHLGLTNAKIDGVTDDYPAMQKLFTYLAGISKPKIVLFPYTGSTMMLSNTIDIRAHDNLVLVMLCDLQLTKTTKDVDANLYCMYIHGKFSTTPSHNIRLYGNFNTLYGNGANIVGYDYATGGTRAGCFLMEYVQNGIIKNIRFVDGLVSCFTVQACQNVSVDAIYAKGSHHDNGVTISGVPPAWLTFDANNPATWNNIVVTNSFAEQCTDLGFTSINAVGVVFDNCVASKCGNTAGYNAGGGFSCEQVNIEKRLSHVIYRNCRAYGCYNFGFECDSSEVIYDGCVADKVISTAPQTNLMDAANNFGIRYGSGWCIMLAESTIKLHNCKVNDVPYACIKYGTSLNLTSGTRSTIVTLADVQPKLIIEDTELSNSTRYGILTYNNHELDLHNVTIKNTSAEPIRTFLTEVGGTDYTLFEYDPIVKIDGLHIENSPTVLLHHATTIDFINARHNFKYTTNASAIIMDDADEVIVDGVTVIEKPVSGTAITALTVHDTVTNLYLGTILTNAANKITNNAAHTYN